jgi:NitT/TauT family transport system permease protein
MKKKRSRTLRGILEASAPLFATLLFLGIWEFLSRTGRISHLFFPAPSEILITLWNMILSGQVLSNFWASLVRIWWGLLLGLIPGVILGLGMGWSKRIRKFVDPFIAALHPLPKLAVFPLIMILFGIGEASKIVAVAISVFFPVLINSMAGVRQLNPVYFEVARNYGAKRWNTFTHIVIPGSLPMILAGVRIAFNLALVITIAVELLTANEGLGVNIWFAWQTLRTQELYATLIVIALLGMVLNYLLQLLSSLLIPWHQTAKEKY